MELTHRKNSPWYILASENNLLDAFRDKKINTTDLLIDLSVPIRDDAKKLALYEDSGHVDHAFRRC